jgi:flagellin-like hook-associated protein FlgL
MTRLQNVVASQGQISKASDDPVTASLSLSLTSSLKGLADYQNTATQAGEWLSSNDFSMGKMSEAAIRAIGLVTSGLNDTEGTVERGSYANELDGILKQGWIWPIPTTRASIFIPLSDQYQTLRAG